MFAYGFPTDRMMELQEAQVEMQLHLTTRNRILNKLGENNVPELLEAVDNERLHEASLDAFINEMTMGSSEDAGTSNTRSLSNNGSNSNGGKPPIKNQAPKAQ